MEFREKALICEARKNGLLIRKLDDYYWGRKKTTLRWLWYLGSQFKQRNLQIPRI
jgi:hypothetical protein